MVSILVHDLLVFEIYITSLKHTIDLLAILRKSLDRAFFLYIFYARVSNEWRESFDCNCSYPKILQNVMKYRSIQARFQNS